MKGPTKLKVVGPGGRLALGKKYSGRQFEVEERLNGELLLRPVRWVRDGAVPALGRHAPAFRIAEVEQVVLPSNDQQYIRGK